MAYQLSKAGADIPLERFPIKARRVGYPAMNKYTEQNGYDNLGDFYLKESPLQCKQKVFFF